LETANEIKHHIECIRYYNKEIEKLTRQQFAEDSNLSDINTQVGSIRFDALGAIGAGCNWIGNYCDNMEKNLETAIKQGKVLHSVEEE